MIAHALAALAAPLSTVVAPSASVPVVLQCAPPIDRPLLLRMESKRWGADGKPLTVVITRRLVFHRDGAGYTLDARLLDATTDSADSKLRDRVLVGLGVAEGAGMQVRLNAQGAVTGVDDQPRRWQEFLDRQAAQRRLIEQQGGSTEFARKVEAQMAAMPPAAQLSALTGFAQPVTRYCGATLPIGTERPVDGVATLTSHVDTAKTRENDVFHLDANTGLAQTIDRNVTLIDDPARPLTEHWTLTPEN